MKNKFENAWNYALAILFGIAVGLLFCAIIDYIATPNSQQVEEPACSIERNTVVYPDGNDEARITNECLVRAGQ
jgi:hypothetical protein